MKSVILYTLAIFTSISGSFAQGIVTEGNYNIKQPDRGRKECKRLLTAIRSFPKEERLSPVIEDGVVYLRLNDRKWLDLLIKGRSDGVAIDLVQQSQFGCTTEEKKSPWFSHDGFLMKPLYRTEIRRNTFELEGGGIAVYVGTVPDELANIPVEANYIILQKKYLCYSNRMINIDFHGWQLLENGLYYDTLSHDALKERYQDVTKTLHFVVPFQKNKSEYNQQDIRPLTDSLEMTDYAIREISIKSYTSIEGDPVRNMNLQNERAESIVSALQSYQSEKIQSTISTYENWVDFLEDIQNSPYKYLVSLSKEQVKEIVQKKDVQEKLEPLLQSHRKAVIEIKLEKRLSLRENDPLQLKEYFLQAIENKNIEEALYLQQVIFYKIRKRQLPENYLADLGLPEALENGRLLINRESFLYDQGATDVYEAIKVFTRLKTLLPNNPRIDYNLCALELEAWLRTDLLQPNENLRKRIEALRAKKIPDVLVRRLLINYHIILSEVHLRNQNYAAKDKALLFIYQTYVPLKLNDNDLVNLAKYFSHYSKFDWATTLLSSRVKSIDASEDLLFYYLSLTIFNTRNTASVPYRTMMLNAVNQNRKRFCGLFNSSYEGGVSFQLLEDPNLKKTYCENCQAGNP